MTTFSHMYKRTPLTYAVSLIVLLWLSILLHGCTGIMLPITKKAWEVANTSDTAAVDSGQWIMEGANPRRDRNATSQLMPPLELVQTFQIEADTQLGSPVSVDQQRVFVEGEHRLHALALTSNTEHWSIEVPGSYISPAVAGKRVIVRAEAGNDGYIIALNKDTGQKLWAYQFPQVGSPYGNMGGHVSAPLIVNEQVLVSACQTFCALDLTNGQEIWAFDADEPITSSASSDEETVFFTSFGRLYALDIQTGVERWHFEPNSSENMLLFAPVVLDDIVFTTSYDTAYALNGHTGQVLWQWTVANKRLIPAGGNSAHIYVKTIEHLYALDRTDGTPQWRFETTSYVSLPAITDSHLYVITRNEGQVRLQAISQKTGEPVWYTTHPNLANASPVIANGKIYIKTIDGGVLVYAPSIR